MRRLLHNYFIILLLFFGIWSCKPAPTIQGRENMNFNKNWTFTKAQPKGDSWKTAGFDDSKWDQVMIPHTMQVEELVMKRQWQGKGRYRKTFSLPQERKGQNVLLRFEGVMTVADVWLNGQKLGRHEGGFLPFVYDITPHAKFGEENILALTVDNNDNPEVPPGKPISKLDFASYGGIYRNVNLIFREPLHITEDVEINRIGGGGITATFPEASEKQALVSAKANIRNTGKEKRRFTLKNTLLENGRAVSSANTENLDLASGQDLNFTTEMTVDKPNLWSPENPHLYTLRTEVLENGKPVDMVETRIGIRRIGFDGERRFLINGKPTYLRGANRHQEYPYVGYAISPEADYRDAYKIKQGGFDFIRLSHYPHSPAFMDACDELGIVVMNCIPGWQFIGNDKFKDLAVRDVREMIRRDRNHACAMIWETSLNESWQDETMRKRFNDAAKEELPGDQNITSSWQEGDFDMFVEARQHGGCQYDRKGVHRPLNAPVLDNKPSIVSEYGDWEYYAQNHGFHQTEFKGLKKEHRNSRQPRGAGEVRLIQQAFNYQEAHNDNLRSRATGDAIWVMYDYNRGYSPDLEHSGPMDIFRLPKFAYRFFQSQRDASENVKDQPHGPVLHIASYWTEKSKPHVRVYANADEVELFLNGKSIGKRKADTDEASTELNYPPFSFDLNKFVPGELKAVSYLKGKKQAETSVRTPGKASKLSLTADISGKKFKPESGDMIFVYATITDANSTTVPDAQNEITFSVEGPAKIIGQNPIKAEAGIIGALVRGTGKAGTITVSAKSVGLKSGKITL
ncbi:beta-galactosidase [Fulvitalea axinellae]|uniref:Beta-galactosidase n=1 Tax=Fulvitalea axinellae TaxID=1182444 RepID=A0AAU9DDZ6_9BACT|nr:beta-galactosidase [Fulvitalea axinellae]